MYAYFYGNVLCNVIDISCICDIIWGTYNVPVYVFFLI